MNNKILFLIGLIALSFAFISCGDDDEPSSESFTLNFSGLEDLGPDAKYEGWLIVDGAPVTTGVFTVDSDGSPSSSEFSVSAEDLASASTFVLTIEPSPDNDPAPSAVHVLAGDFVGSSASLTIDHEAALGNDFASSEGKYILATPTDTDENNESSGIWFLEITSTGPAVGLDLPILPEGWAYEGWAVIDGTPVSTGTFTDVANADGAAIYSGAESGPPFQEKTF